MLSAYSARGVFPSVPASSPNNDSSREGFIVLKISNGVSLCESVPLPYGYSTTYEGCLRSIRDPTFFSMVAAMPTRPMGPSVRSLSFRYNTACSLE